jgi:hypothetical protein
MDGWVLMRPEFCGVCFPALTGSRLVVARGGDLCLLGLEQQRAIPIPIKDIGMRLLPIVSEE